jgi:RNA polymerase-binding protein DksA
MDRFVGNAELLRRSALRELLTRARIAHGERLVGLGAICSNDRGSSSGDEMDVASEHAEAATHARLIEHRWSTQAVLDDALERLRLGLYGVCEECGEEISLERLRVMPFAAYCIDCQHQREHKKAVEGLELETFFRLAASEPPVHNSAENDVAETGERRGLEARLDATRTEIKTHKKHLATPRSRRFKSEFK